MYQSIFHAYRSHQRLLRVVRWMFLLPELLSSSCNLSEGAIDRLSD